MFISLSFQFPCAFEFNENFLITVLDHLTRYDKIWRVKK